MEYDNEYFENLDRDKLSDLETLTFYSQAKIDTLSEEKKKELKAYREYIAGKEAERQAIEEEDKPTIGELAGGLGTQLVNIPTIGQGDEIMGGIVGGTETLFDALRGKERRPEDLAENVGKRIDQFRGFEEDFRQRFPVTAGGIDVIGGGASAIGLAKNAPRLTNFLLRGSPALQTIKQAGAGGLLGAGYDFGYSEGTPSERVDSGTALSGGLGAGLSLLARPLVSLASGIGRRGTEFIDRLRGVDRADIRLREAFSPVIDELGGEEFVKREIQKGKPIITQGTDGQVAYDAQTFLAGDKGLDLTGTGMSAEKSSNVVRRFLNNETNKVVAQTHKDLIDNFGGEVKNIPIEADENILSYIRRLSKINLGQATKKYDDAKLNQPLSNDELEAVRRWADDPRIRKVIDPDDVTLISSKESLDSPFTFDEKGILRIDGDVTLAEVESLREVMDDFLEQSATKIKVRKGLAKNLREILDKGNPNLKSARSQYRLAKEQAEIDEQAQLLFRDSKFDAFEDYYTRVINDDTTLLSKADKIKAFRRNAQFEIEKGLKDSGSLNRYLRSLNDPNSNKLQLLEIVYPKKELEKIIEQVDKANSFLSARAKFSGGSDTMFKVTQRGLDAETLASPLRAFIKSFDNRKLDDAEIRKIANVLISDNPDIIDQFGNRAYDQYFTRRLQVLIPSVIGGQEAQQQTN